GRAPIVHLKDFVGQKGESNPYALIGMKDDAVRDANTFEFRPVGYGCQNFVDIVDAAKQAGAEWVIVEQDDSTARTPLEDAKLSIGYLKSIGL
ncbi:MAG: sugar phosphate isomerase/epimerase, partial [Clostridia bacterium]|nr:sugar phosphate isomerase/epimerase [Clostridia bacterium]